MQLFNTSSSFIGISSLWVGRSSLRVETVEQALANLLWPKVSKCLIPALIIKAHITVTAVIRGRPLPFQRATTRNWSHFLKNRLQIALLNFCGFSAYCKVNFWWWVLVVVEVIGSSIKDCQGLVAAFQQTLGPAQLHRVAFAASSGANSSKLSELLATLSLPQVPCCHFKLQFKRKAKYLNVDCKLWFYSCLHRAHLITHPMQNAKSNA